MPVAPPAPPPLRLSVLLGLGVGLLQALVLLNPEMVLLDCEELYNATHGAEVLHGHLDRALDLQYRGHCGGCTLDALLAAAAFALLGTSFLAWKMVPIAFTVLLAVVGHQVLGRVRDRATANLFVLLLALPPFGWSQLSLLAWGNHYECGVLGTLVFLALLLDPGRRAVAAVGLLCGFGLWVGPSMAWAVLGAGGMLLARRRWREIALLVAGALAGWSPALLRWAWVGEGPLGTIYREGEAFPSLARVPGQVQRFFEPATLVALFGLPTPRIGLVLSVAWLVAFGVVLVLAARRGPGPARWGLAFLATWASLYALSDFRLKTATWPDLVHPMWIRYAAPFYPMAFLLLALVAGRLWSDGARRRALLLLAPALATGLAARAAASTPPFPSLSVLDLPGTDYDYFRYQGTYAIPIADHATCTTREPRSLAFHAFALGRDAAWTALDQGATLAGLEPPAHLPRGAWIEGVGSGAVDRLDPDNTGRLPLLGAVQRALVPLGPDQPAALAEAAWERNTAHDPWSLPGQDRTDAGLREVRASLRSTTAPLPAAWLRAWGRRWARAEADWAQPARLAFPAGEGPEMEDFAWGWGHGLGEAWGPRATIPRPDGLPEDLLEPLLDGYVAGAERAWRSGAGRPDLVDDGTRVPDRWWREGAPLRGACH